MAKAKKATDAFIDLFTPKGKSPRMSRDEAEQAGYYHPIGGGLKLSRPISEMQGEYLPTEGINMIPERVFDPAKMVGGASVPLVGDNALGGLDLIAINGMPLSDQVTLQAGRSFMRQNPNEAFASGEGVSKNIDSRIEQALREGATDVYGSFVSMSPTAVDYNTMLFEAMLRSFDPLTLSKMTAKEFDQAMVNFAIKNKKTGKTDYPAQDFVGLRDPRLEEQMLDQSSGPLRKVFADRAQMKQFQTQGLPDVAAARFAISDPTMLDLPLGTTGLDIARFKDSNRLTQSSPNPHKTYSTHILGDYVGGLETPVSYKDYFQTFFDARRLLGNKPSEENYAFQRSMPIQHHDQEWLDRLMKSIEAQKNLIKTGSYAEGGMVESAPQEAIADTVQNPNAARMLEMDLANLALMQQPQQIPKRMAAGGVSKMLRVMHGSPTKIKTTNERPLHVTTDSLYATKRGSDKLDQMGMEGPPMVNRYDIPEDKLLRMDETMYSPETINLMRRYWNRIPADKGMTGEEIYDLLSANKQPFDRLLPGISEAGGFLGYQRPATGTGGRDEWFKIMKPESLEIVKKKGGAVKQPTPEEMRIEMMERGYGKR